MDPSVLFAVLLVGNVVSTIANPVYSKDNNVQVNIINLIGGHPISNGDFPSILIKMTAGEASIQTSPSTTAHRSPDESDEGTDVLTQSPPKMHIQVNDESKGTEEQGVQSMTNTKINISTRTSCRQVKAADKDVKSTEYDHLVLANLYDGTEVMCDTETDQGGWMVIQMRTKGDTIFNRTWDDYKYGFGDFDHDFWFGLEKIHHMTTKARHELRIDMQFEGKNYFAEYSQFRVLGEAEKYKLELGEYSGNTPEDNMSYQNNTVFTTIDRDNDNVGTNNCAVIYKGGWWYNDCHYVNLNGEWGNTEYGKGLTWRSLTTSYKSLNWVEMKIRPY